MDTATRLNEESIELTRSRLVVIATSVLTFAALMALRYASAYNLSPYQTQTYDFLFGWSHANYYPFLPPDVSFTYPTIPITWIGAWTYGLIYYLHEFVLGTSMWGQFTLAFLLNAVAFMGGPLLFEYAIRIGLRPKLSALAAVLYTLCYIQLEVSAGDTCSPAGTAYIVAALALVLKRPWMLALGLLVVIGSHPVSWLGVVLFVWATRLFPSRGQWLVTPTWLAIPVTVVCFALTGFTILMLYHQNASWVSLEASRLPNLMDAIEREQVWNMLIFNLTGVLLLLASFGFLPLTRSRFLLLALPDIVYYLFSRWDFERSSVDHGLVNVTVGLLALASVDALLKLPSITARLRHARLALAGVTPLLPWLAAACLGWSRFDVLVPREFLPTPRIAAVHEAISMIPEGSTCETHTSFGPVAETRCSVTTFFRRTNAPEGDPFFPRPDYYLVDYNRLAGQEDSPGFPGVARWDGGCKAIRRVLDDVRTGWCRLTWQRDSIGLLACGKQAVHPDVDTANYLSNLAAKCVPEDLH